MLRIAVLTVSHGLVLVVGLALGIYLLPILTQPTAPDAALLQQQAELAEFSGSFAKDLEGSDFLHWGEGTVSVSSDMIVHTGKLAPGPDYKLYLVKDFVDTEAAFEAVKDSSIVVGDVKTFGGFLVDVPEGVDVTEYSTVLIWCEAFSEFITAAKYQ